MRVQALARVDVGGRLLLAKAMALISAVARMKELVCRHGRSGRLSSPSSHRMGWEVWLAVVAGSHTEQRLVDAHRRTP